ncbi:hypothetical protein EW145_g7257, partial [Phellinidium pouzarii]
REALDVAEAAATAEPAANQQHAAPRVHARAGRKGLATAAISLRGASEPGPMVAPIVLKPSSPATRAALRATVQKIRIVPSPPSLLTLCTSAAAPAAADGVDTSTSARFSQARDEFKLGWVEGIATLRSIWLRLQTSQKNGTIRVMVLSDDADMDAEAEAGREEGLVGFADLESCRWAELDKSQWPCAVLCLAGERPDALHAEGCGHSVTRDLWVDNDESFHLAQVTECIRRAIPRSLFSLQLAYWPYKRTFPIQKLPPELLAEIFIYCLPEEHESAQASRRAAPLSVSSVCCSWRQLALSLPRLWARFDLVQRAVPAGDVRALEMAKAWISRSRNVPLSFSLCVETGAITRRVAQREEDGDGDDDKDEDEDSSQRHRKELYTLPFRPLCEAVLEQQHRWKRVSIDYAIEESASHPEMDMVDMPLLEELDLSLPSPGSKALVDLAHSPRLQKLSLSGDFTVALGSKNLEHLKTVHLDLGKEQVLTRFPDTSNLISIADLLAVINRTPNVEHLSASVCGVADPPDKDGSISLSSLRSFSLNVYESNGVSVKTVFSSLTLPSLEDFSLSICSIPRNNASFGIADLLTRSGAQLTRLSLQAPSVTSSEVLMVLRCCVHLVDLVLVDQIRSKEETRALVFALTPTSRYKLLSGHANTELGDTYLCPMLQTLEFSASQIRSLYSEFAAMIALRWSRKNVGLREVRMREQDTWFIGDQMQVKKCIKEGLKLIPFDEFSGRNRKRYDRLL